MSHFQAMYGYSSPNTEMALPETAAHVNKNSLSIVTESVS
jgi:hypothetical protein